jgi:hypothetical protein
MDRIRSSRMSAAIVAIAAGALVLVVIAGCAAQTPAGGTAKSNLPLAQSKIATTAPDAKLLLVQTGNVVTATSTPAWTYLFGSPKTNTIYAVMVKDGTASAPMPYGNADLPAAEWAAVPGPDAWKVDSDVALEKALAAASAQGTSVPYAMGLVTYVPKTTTATVEAFVWNVVLDPEARGGAKAKAVNISAKTGEVKTTK